jgi:hypothetical protein
MQSESVRHFLRSCTWPIGERLEQAKLDAEIDQVHGIKPTPPREHPGYLRIGRDVLRCGFIPCTCHGVLSS